MRDKTTLDDLDTKIMLLSERHRDLKDENQRLKIELETVQKLLKISREELENLQSKEELNDLELEDVVGRINQAMGLVYEEKNVA